MQSSSRKQQKLLPGAAKAHHIVIPLKIIHNPPPSINNWSVPNILLFLRSLGIDVEVITTWCRDQATGGYQIWFHGEEPSQKALRRLAALH